MEYIDSSKLSISTYFGLIAQAFVSKAGYQRGLNLKGAPYDWRKAPDELVIFEIDSVIQYLDYNRSEYKRVSFILI